MSTLRNVVKIIKRYFRDPAVNPIKKCPFLASSAPIVKEASEACQEDLAPESRVSI